MGASIRLGRIFGIPIIINFSWVFIFFLVTYTLSAQFGDSYPRWNLIQQWATAGATSLLFFTSVLAHELSHSLLAVRKGIPVRGITLFIFGGVSHLAHEARRPMTEFLVAVVGPASSLLLGLLFFAASRVLQDVSETLAAICIVLSPINFMLGIFNMLPGFPLDGGRVLRAAVWGITGSYWRGTQIAARAGQAIGGLMVAGGIAWLLFAPEVRFQGLWFALIGAFLFSAATTSYRQEQIRENLKNYTVADVMRTGWNVLPGETLAGSPAVAQALAGREEFVAVLTGDRIGGIFTRRQLARLPAATAAQIPLGMAMTPLSAMPKVSPEEPMFGIIERLEAENMDRLAVVRDDALLGLVSREDVMRWLQRGPQRAS
ncbi:MAG: site-2 protease family protein [SAR202 cluster bacterium]|nr:site-2 protease family protein [SAR202 cluster bacterium]